MKFPKILFLTFFVAAVTSSQAADWKDAKAHSQLPALKPGSKECAIVFRAAKAAFLSDQAEIPQAVSALKGKGYGLILAPDFNEIAEQKFWFDSHYIQTDKQSFDGSVAAGGWAGNDQYLFYQKEAVDGARFLLMDTALGMSAGWSLYRLDQSLSYDKVVAMFRPCA